VSLQHRTVHGSKGSKSVHHRDKSLMQAAAWSHGTSVRWPDTIKRGETETDDLAFSELERMAKHFICLLPQAQQGERPQGTPALDQSSVAAVTKHHRLGSLHNKHSSPHNPEAGRPRSRSKCWQSWLFLEGCEEICPRPWILVVCCPYWRALAYRRIFVILTWHADCVHICVQISPHRGHQSCWIRDLPYSSVT
jgi:hypothetical protein